MEAVPYTTVESTLCTSLLVECDGFCILQAMHNKEVYDAAQIPGLKLVSGSLGIGQDEPFFEYGGKDFDTAKDYLQSTTSSRYPDGTFCLDAHVWIEDGRGRIYDIVTPQMLTTSRVRRKELSAWITVHKPIEGIERSVLAGRGLHYVAASKDTSNVLITLMNRGRGFENIVRMLKERLASCPLR